MSKKINIFTRSNNFFKQYILNGIFDKNSKNILQQISELIYVAYKTKYVPYNYYKYNCGYMKDVNVQDVINYIPGELWDSIRDGFLNNDRYSILVEDKYLFSKILSVNNIPSTEVLGLYIPNVGFVDKNCNSVNQEEFLKNIDSDFVIKPVSGSVQGQGVNVYNFSEIVNLQEFLNTLKESIKAESLVERKIIQHKKLSELYPDSVNTVRIDTLKKINGEIVIGRAILRLGKNGRKVDNWSGPNAGIGVPIDLETGKLTEFGRDYSYKKYYEHPNTGIIFKDYDVPYFKETVELAKKAALLFPKVNLLGWDICTTENGPRIIETNHNYDYSFTQVGGPLLKNIPFVNAVKEYIDSSDKGKKYRKYFDNIMKQV